MQTQFFCPRAIDHAAKIRSGLSDFVLRPLHSMVGNHYTERGPYSAKDFTGLSPALLADVGVHLAIGRLPPRHQASSLAWAQAASILGNGHYRQ